MPWSVQLTREDEFAHFLARGENTPENVRSYLREVMTVCLRDGLRRVLIEEALDGPRLYSGEVASIAGAVGPQTARLFEKLAYVDTRAPDPALNMQFAGAVAADAGLNIRVFPDVAAARAWLLDQDAGR